MDDKKGDISKSNTQLLSPSEIEKIKAEEALRKQIRDAFSPQKSDNGFFAFLNSSLGLLLVSGLLIGGLGQLITRQLDTLKNKQETKKDAVRYVTELDERIFRLNFFLIKNDTCREIDKKRYFSTGLDAVKLGADQWYHPIFSDFKEVPIQRLIYWLKINVKNDENAQSALKAIQTLVPDDRGICNSSKAKNCIMLLEKYKDEVEEDLKE